MARKDSEHQKISMSLLFRGKAIFKPMNTGHIDEHVSCIREWVANIFFYTKNGTTIMIDAGYNYDRLRENTPECWPSPLLRHVRIRPETLPEGSAFAAELPELWPWWCVPEKERVKTEMQADPRWEVWVRGTRK